MSTKVKQETYHYWIFTILMILALVMSSCASPTTPTTSPVTEPTAENLPVATTAVKPTKTPEQKAEEATQEPEMVELTFWQHSYEPADNLTKNLIMEYEAANPNVKINFEVTPYDQQLTKLLAATAGGQAPDIYDIRDTDLLVFASKGALAPVDPKGFGFDTMEEFEASYVPNSLNDFRGPDGTLYGVHTQVNSWILAINNRIFEEAGLDPTVDYPKTWDELAQIGGQLAVENNGVWERQGFNWLLLHSGLAMIMYPPIVYQLGGSVLTENDRGNQCALNNPEGIEALQIMKDVVYKYGAGGVGVNIASGSDPNADFLQEKAAMWITGPWAIPAIQNTPALTDNFTMVPLPQAADGKQKVVTTTSWAWVVNSDSPQQREAWRFVEYMSSQAPRWLAEVGTIIPRLGWEETPEAKDFPFLDVFLEELAYGRSRLQHPSSAEINEEVFKAVQAALLDDAQPQEALDAACTEINKILGN